MEGIPVTITVSRETGQIVGVECGNVTEEGFRKVCQALIKGGREAEEHVAVYRGTGNRNGSGRVGDGHTERETGREAKEEA